MNGDVNVIVSLIVSLPLNSSDPIFSKATLGVSEGYNDLYKDEPIIEKSTKFIFLCRYFIALAGSPKP